MGSRPGRRSKADATGLAPKKSADTQNPLRRTSRRGFWFFGFGFWGFRVETFFWWSLGAEALDRGNATIAGLVWPGAPLGRLLSWPLLRRSGGRGLHDLPDFRPRVQIEVPIPIMLAAAGRPPGRQGRRRSGRRGFTGPHRQIPVLKAHGPRAVQTLLHPHRCSTQARPDLAAIDLIPLSTDPHGVIVADHAMFHPAPDRLQVVLLPQGPMSIGRFRRFSGQFLVHPR